MPGLSLAQHLWALPCSLIGLMLALLPVALGGRARHAGGVLEVTYRPTEAACGRFASRLPFRGIVFGHVILALTEEELHRIRPHELVHVAQYERWGPLFFIAYGASSVWQLLRGRSPYWDNHFEVQARLLSADASSATGCD